MTGEQGGMAAPEFIRSKFAWLAQVAADVALPTTSVRIAILLMDYFKSYAGK